MLIMTPLAPLNREPRASRPSRGSGPRIPRRASSAAEAPPLQQKDQDQEQAPSSPSSSSKRRPRGGSGSGSGKQRPKGPVKVSTGEPTIYDVPHHSQYTTDEINSIWFTKLEIDRTISECKETVQCMQDGIPFLEDDDQAFTTRGLEYMTAGGFDITTSSLDAVKLVLEEQERQRQDDEYDGAPDPLALADAIQGISMHRLRIAHLAAMKDARGVYGDGKFKTTAVKGGAPVRSLSMKARRAGRGLLGRSISTGNIRERRSRRGSRAPLNHSRKIDQPQPHSNANRAKSDPSAEAIKTAATQLKRHSVGM
jgi:hypothetical protein